MMEFIFASSRKQQRLHYLYGYYHRPILWFQRRFFGPFILFAGMALIALKRRFDYLETMFVVFGLYYIARPFISAARIAFKDSKLKASFEDSCLRLSDESADWKIRSEEVRRLKIKGSAVFLQFKQAYPQWIIFNLDFLENGKDEFLGKIKDFAGA
jgi:hypothetical protein